MWIPDHALGPGRIGFAREVFYHDLEDSLRQTDRQHSSPNAGGGRPIAVQNVNL